MSTLRSTPPDTRRAAVRLVVIFAATQIVLVAVTRHSVLPAFTPVVDTPFNVRWWLALSTLMSREGLFGSWSPYPPVFPTLHLVLYEAFGFDTETLWRHFFLGDPAVRSSADVLVGRATLLWAGLNAALLVALGVCVGRLATRVRGEGRGMLAGAAFVLMSQSYASRMLIGLANDQFDYLPCLLLLGAVAAVLGDAPARAGALAALGTLTKLFPVILVPFALVRVRGRTARLAFLGALTALGAAVAAPFAVLGERPLWSWLRYTAARSGWESVWTYPKKALPPWPPASEMRGLFDVPHTAAAADGTRLDAVLPILTVGALALLVFFVRRRLGTAPAFVRAVLLAVVVLLFFAKGFSSYYVQWFLPLLFVVYRADVAALWFAAFLVAANLEFLAPLPELPWYWPSIFLRHALLSLLAVDQLWRLWLAPRVVEAHP